jgi:molybdenum cofactor guanylyltransferase
VGCRLQEGRAVFHPRQMAFVGHSGSGKTTLIEKMIARWSSSYRVGYAKHDGHHFEMDREGKDTQRMSKAGAHAVSIEDSKMMARLGQARSLPQDLFFQDCDLVIVEGHKQADFPKMLFTDGDILPQDLEYPHQVLATVSQNAQPKEWEDRPHFHRDDLEGIENYILSSWPSPALDALVLMGGRSTRMGQDKYALEMSGDTLLQRTRNLLKTECQQVYVSGREDQKEMISDFIPDRLLDMGPIGGILSAMESFPDRAFLVCAVDLPRLSSDLVATLIRERDPFKVATAFTIDGFNEPLCAIYEPHAKAELYQAIGRGRKCPRSVLKRANTKLIPCPEPDAMGNANTPEDFQRLTTEIV